MRKFLIVLAFFALPVGAETHLSPNSVFFDVGMAPGGFTFGGAYEYLYNGAESVGGQAHIYQKDSTRGVDGYMLLGGFTGFHFFKGAWDLSFAPGVNIMSISSANPRVKNTTTLGPSLQVSLVVALNARVGLGFDYANYYGWFDDNYRGLRISDLDFKVKINF